MNHSTMDSRMKHSERFSLPESLRFSPVCSSVSDSSMPYFLLSACICCTSFGSFTVSMKMARDTSMMPAMMLKYSV